MTEVLLVKTSSLGDVVHNLPVVSDLVATYPDLAISWIFEESLSDVPRGWLVDRAGTFGVVFLQPAVSDKEKSACRAEK